MEHYPMKGYQVERQLMEEYQIEHYRMEEDQVERYQIERSNEWKRCERNAREKHKRKFYCFPGTLWLLNGRLLKTTGFLKSVANLFGSSSSGFIEEAQNFWVKSSTFIERDSESSSADSS